MCVLQRVREEVGWPKDAILCSPRLLRLAIQTVDENNVHPCLGMSIHGRALKPRYLLVDGSLDSPKGTECQQNAITDQSSMQGPGPIREQQS